MQFSVPAYSAEVRRKFFDGNDQAQSVDMPERGVMYSYPGHPGGPASDLRVLGIAGDAAACGQFRVKYPLMVLASLGAKVDARVVLPEVPLTAADVLDINVLLVQRQVDPELLRLAASLARVAGVALVYDLDDYLHGVSPQSPAYPVYNPNTPQGRRSLNGISRFLRESDGVLFSTRELQALYAPDYSHVLENGLDTTLGDRDWDLGKPRYDWKSVADAQGCPVDADSLAFGWSGGSTHAPDLAILGDSVKRILERVPNTFFLIQTHPLIAKQFCVDVWGLPLDRVVCIPATQFKDYPRSLSGADVCLAPLENTPFNRSKSSLRILEFGNWGIPYVASAVAPFQRFHTESGGVGGYLAERGSGFVGPAVRLLTDRDERLERGRAVLEHTRSRHDIRHTMRSLPYTLESVLAHRFGGVSLPSRVEVEDSRRGLPRLSPQVRPKDPCPCGSGRPYKRCCAPAWGQI